MDCRPFRYRDTRFVINRKVCSKRCPYYSVCLKEYKKLSQKPEAILSRVWREKQQFLINN